MTPFRVLVIIVGLMLAGAVSSIHWLSGVALIVLAGLGGVVAGEWAIGRWRRK